MIKKGDIIKVVSGAVDEINELRPRDQLIEKDLSSSLVGSEGSLDSLGVVNLLVALEEKLGEQLGHTIIVTEDEDLLAVDGPLNTIGTLVNYLVERFC
jgi:acyl carrier protein